MIMDKKMISRVQKMFEFCTSLTSFRDGTETEIQKLKREHKKRFEDLDCEELESIINKVEINWDLLLLIVPLTLFF